MNTISFGSSASATLTKAPIKGRFNIEHWRAGEKINEFEINNAVTNEGKNYFLGVMFKGATANANWFIGLINNAGYTTLAVTDTYDNIDQAGNGWDEFATYTDTNNASSASTRPAWNRGSVSAQSLTSSSSSTFDMTGSGTVKGLFCVAGTNAQTKSDHTTSNYLWATALFTAGDVVVANGDQLKVTYTATASA
jgi:hypothetical protein